MLMAQNLIIRRTSKPWSQQNDRLNKLHLLHSMKEGAGAQLWKDTEDTEHNSWDDDNNKRFRFFPLCDRAFLTIMPVYLEQLSIPSEKQEQQRVEFFLRADMLFNYNIPLRISFPHIRENSPFFCSGNGISLSWQSANTCLNQHFHRETTYHFWNLMAKLLLRLSQRLLSWRQPAQNYNTWLELPCNSCTQERSPALHHQLYQGGHVMAAPDNVGKDKSREDVFNLCI